MCDLKPRDIVECVDDRAQLAESKVMPVAGQLYTVDRIWPVGGGHGVRLTELTPTCYLGGPCGCGGCGWDADRFRRIYRPDDRLIAGLATPVEGLVEAG